MKHIVTPRATETTPTSSDWDRFSFVNSQRGDPKHQRFIAYASALTSEWEFLRSEHPIATPYGSLIVDRDGLFSPTKIKLLQQDGSYREILGAPATIDGDRFLASYSLNPTCSILAVAESLRGRDLLTWRFISLLDGRELPYTHHHTRDTSLCWSSDTEIVTGVYAPTSSTHARASRPVIYKTDIETGVQEVVFDSALSFPRFRIHVGRHPGQVIVLEQNGGGPADSILLLDLVEQRSIQSLVSVPGHEFYYAGADGNGFYFVTDLEANNGRLVAVSEAAHSTSQCKEIVPESDLILERASLHDGMFVCRYWDGWRHSVKIISAQGIQGELSLTSPGAIHSVCIDNDTVSATFSTPTTKPTSVSCPLHRKSSVHTADTTDFTVCEAQALDKERIPYLMINPGEGKPVLLTGYGGFGERLTPSFDPLQKLWIEAGGSVAFAGVRGGGEKGSGWYAASRGPDRKRSFDDFNLIATQIRSDQNPSVLVASGYSTGALLVSGASLMMPMNFDAVICCSGLYDFDRYADLSIGRAWLEEFGDPSDKAHRTLMAEWAPIDLLKQGAKLPPAFIAAGFSDDTVPYTHSKNLYDVLADGESDIYVAISSGHSRNALGSMITFNPQHFISQNAAILSFLTDRLGIEFVKQSQL